MIVPYLDNTNDYWILDRDLLFSLNASYAYMEVTIMIMQLISVHIQVSQVGQLPPFLPILRVRVRKCNTFY